MHCGMKKHNPSFFSKHLGITFSISLLILSKPDQSSTWHEGINQAAAPRDDVPYSKSMSSHAYSFHFQHCLPQLKWDYRHYQHLQDSWTENAACTTDFAHLPCNCCHDLVSLSFFPPQCTYFKCSFCLK